jgi:hypothetical protein
MTLEELSECAKNAHGGSERAAAALQKEKSAALP